LVTARILVAIPQPQTGFPNYSIISVIGFGSVALLLLVTLGEHLGAAASAVILGILGFLIHNLIRLYGRTVILDSNYSSHVLFFFAPLFLAAAIAALVFTTQLLDVLTGCIAFICGSMLGWTISGNRLHRLASGDEAFLIPPTDINHPYLKKAYHARQNWPVLTRLGLWLYAVLVRLGIYKETKDHLKVQTCLLYESRRFDQVIATTIAGNRILQSQTPSDFSDTLRSLGILAQIRLGHMRQAESEINAVLKQDSESPYFLHIQAYLLWHSGNLRVNRTRERKVSYGLVSAIKSIDV